MTLTAAPLFDDIADGPSGGAAYWAHADDGVRIRLGLWPAEGTAKGTVLLFPGRTEYIEKYGRTAADFARSGFATLTVDWRGQGLADRLLPDALSGHVHDFLDYQRDVAVLLNAVDALNLPRPLYLQAHSMGGCIGLRALMNGLPVDACSFTGPMWGIEMASILRPVAWTVSEMSLYAGFSHVYAPGTKPEAYVLNEPFETNQLTRDEDMYAFMQSHMRAHPELALGGPSLRWLNTALKECRALAGMASPDVACLTFLGDAEKIVHTGRVHDRMNAWPKGELVLIEGGEHEVLMEAPDVRHSVTQRITKHFESATKDLGTSLGALSA